MSISKIASIKENPKLKHVHPTLMTVAEFAAHKEVRPPSVYEAIARKKIVPILVGVGKNVYIDSVAYAGYKFKEFAPGTYPRTKVNVDA